MYVLNFISFFCCWFDVSIIYANVQCVQICHCPVVQHIVRVIQHYPQKGASPLSLRSAPPLDMLHTYCRLDIINVPPSHNSSFYNKKLHLHRYSFMGQMRENVSVYCSRTSSSHMHWFCLKDIHCKTIHNGIRDS